MQYRNYLKTEHWKNLKRDKYKSKKCCEICGSKNKTEVHHMRYKNLFNVNPYDLRVLCRSCHQMAHNILNDQNDFNISSKKYCFADIQILVKKKRYLPLVTKPKKHGYYAAGTREMRSVLKSAGIKMSGLSKKHTDMLFMELLNIDDN